ncbi:hypothetical protein BaRGS_00023517 [Batillaria attramentaria]|uniref:Uncharacterized protein n=1 Tax=Batillaria attramentaria TaxID=370345 RepID=A0ABD0KDT4_9CAEN
MTAELLFSDTKVHVTVTVHFTYQDLALISLETAAQALRPSPTLSVSGALHADPPYPQGMQTAAELVILHKTITVFPDRLMRGFVARETHLVFAALLGKVCRGSVGVYSLITDCVAVWRWLGLAPTSTCTSVAGARHSQDGGRY